MSKKLSKKKQQGKTKTTYGKGEESELTISSINPFTNSSELDFPYLGGKAYPPSESSGVRASRPGFREIEMDKVNRKSKSKERTKKKDSKAGGGKVKSKFFTGGTVNPSFGTDYDDR